MSSQAGLSSKNKDFLFKTSGWGYRIRLSSIFLSLQRPCEHTTVCRTKDASSHSVGSTDSKNSHEVQYQLVLCDITSEKENVTVTLQLSPENSFQLSKNRTELLIRGEILYNRDLYMGLNSENHKAEIRVVLVEEKVTDLLPIIIGSSVGGFLLLLIIVAILYKCGFFKRTYKHMMEEEHDS